MARLGSIWAPLSSLYGTFQTICHWNAQCFNEILTLVAWASKSRCRTQLLSAWQLNTQDTLTWEWIYKTKGCRPLTSHANVQQKSDYICQKKSRIWQPTVPSSSISPVYPNLRAGTVQERLSQSHCFNVFIEYTYGAHKMRTWLSSSLSCFLDCSPTTTSCPFVRSIKCVLLKNKLVDSPGRLELRRKLHSHRKLKMKAVPPLHAQYTAPELRQSRHHCVDKRRNVERRTHCWTLDKVVRCFHYQLYITGLRAAESRFAHLQDSEILPTADLDA